MVINILRHVKENTCGVLCANKIRIMGIKDNIRNIKQVGILFDVMSSTIETRDMKKLIYLIERLFYEEIPEGFLEMLVDAYNNAEDKSDLIDGLKQSYIKRGTHGIMFAWLPLIERG